MAINLHSGVTPETFGKVGYLLSSTAEREGIYTLNGVVGLRHEAEIIGIPLTWHNYKDTNNYRWTVAIVAENWCLTYRISMAVRQGTANTKITVHTDQGDRVRYIFNPVLDGNEESMIRDLSLIRMSLD